MVFIIIMHKINYPSFSYPFLLKQRQRLPNLTNIRMSIRVTRQAARNSGQTPSESKQIDPSPSKQQQENKEKPNQAQKPQAPPPPPPAPSDPLEISLYRREEQARQAILYKAAYLDLGLDWIGYQQQLLEDLENPRPVDQNGEAMQRDKQAVDQEEKRVGDDRGQTGNNQEISNVPAEKPKKKVHKVRIAHPSLQVHQTLVDSETLQVQSPPPRGSNGGVYIKDIAVQVNLERPPPLKVLDVDYDENGQEVVRVSYRDREFLCTREYMEQRHMRALIEYYEQLMYTQHVIPKQKKKKKKEKEKEKDMEEKEKEKATAEEAAKTGQNKIDKDPNANVPADNQKPPEKERQNQSKMPELQHRRRSSRVKQSESRSKGKKKNKN